MLDSFALLSAMRGIRDEYVIDAAKTLGYTDTVERSKTRHFNRKLWSTLLVAAIVISLFTMTAYAMGWFGLRERMIESGPESKPAVTESGSTETAAPVPTAEPKRWVSLNGYADSPEYLANAEWLRFREEYLASHTITNDNSWMNGLDEETVNTCHYYGVYDRNMLDELNALAEQYGLRLHTHQVTPLTLEDFYCAAGTGAFLTEGDGGGYIYEDGSFKMETWGELGKYNLSILKNLSGKILPLSSGMDKPENYQEWEYTNIHRDTVLMAFNEHREDISESIADLRIFFDMDGVFIMAHAVFYGDEPVSRADCEALADKIIFHELLKTEVNIASVQHGPTICTDPGEAAMLADFLSSPEGQAANEYVRLQGELRGTVEGNQRLMELQSTVAEKYGLTYTQTHSLVYSQENIDSGMYDDMDVDLISQEAFAALGYDKQICEQFYEGFDCYNNGLICGATGMEWRYIPNGAFCPFLTSPIAADYTQQWFYRTNCGAVVLIAADLPETERTHVIIYRTGKGWLIGQGGLVHSAYELEYYADTLDYTVFP